jgi:hypothetical protein
MKLLLFCGKNKKNMGMMVNRFFGRLKFDFELSG